MLSGFRAAVSITAWDDLANVAELYAFNYHCKADVRDTGNYCTLRTVHTPELRIYPQASIHMEALSLLPLLPNYGLRALKKRGFTRIPAISSKG